MNRNNGGIKNISALLSKENDINKIISFFYEILTESEIETLSKRWRILEMLNKNMTQREIAKELKVSLCKVTRGAQILKNEKSIINEYLKKGGDDGNKKI